MSRERCLSISSGLSVIIMFIICIAAGGYGESVRVYGREAASPVTIHHVIDGDSLVVLDRGNYLEIRLWGIDAPEYDQPGSEEAKERLKALIESGQAEITIKDRDRYGRTVVMLESSGININEALVASGSAWVHIFYCKESPCEQWKKLESDARKNHLGLWRWENPIEPWKWKLKN